MTQTADTAKPNALHDLGYKIFLDRYAQKDMTRKTLAVGDTVIVVVNGQTGQREIGHVTKMELPEVTIELLDGQIVTRPIENVDKPLETEPGEMLDRVAAGIAEAEATPELRAKWAEAFRWALEDFKFVPAGRILAAAGTCQELTFYNCFVINSPRDSRAGIIETLRQMTEIMSRGGGVGINISSLRPRHSYVKGVNGRSSGAVSWGALYSFVTGLIEQGGCFSGDTRIGTSAGLIPAVELADRMDGGETFYAHTHKGLRRVTARFRNGVKPLYEVTTERGYKVRVTEDHKMAVLADGRVITTPLKYLAVEDEILVLLGNGVKADYLPLKPLDYQRSIMSTTLNENVTLPQALTEDLAYFIGYSIGDGYVQIGKKVNWQAPKALKLATADTYPEICQKLIDVTRQLFNLEPTLEAGNGALVNLAIYSRVLMDWLADNDLLKAKAEHIRVPEAIFRSPSSVQAAFIAGYFDADGCYRGKKGGYGMDSISRPMLADVQQLLAANGIISRINAQDRSKEGWQTIYRLSVTGARFKAKFADWVPTLKRGDAGDREENTYPVEVWKALGMRSKYRQRIHDGVSTRIGYAQLDKIRERLQAAGLTAVADEIRALIQVMPDRIISIEPVGEQETYDFEVDEQHLLSGNGLFTANSRRGALMLILNDDHPDIYDFINAKREAGKITNANISVGISDDFMAAVKADGDWNLVFPDTNHPDYDTYWTGDLDDWKARGLPVNLYRTVKAREIWDAIIQSAWASAEPGLWFKERSNKMSNSWYYNEGVLIATNPCGEQSLPGNGVCNLGAVNLSKFYDAERHDVAWDDLDRTVRTATRFLDNVIDATYYFMDANREQQMNERRVGLNTMGIAELMVKLNIRYGSPESLAFIDKLYERISRAAYETSIALAEEKGAFPKFDGEKFVQSGYMQAMPEDIREAVRTRGIRNVTLLTQAPNGCVAPDTLVSTATGMQSMVTLGNPDGDQWQVMTRKVPTDRGLRPTSHFYINGYQHVKTITTARGFNLTATPNHQIRVIDETGNYVWRRMDAISAGDQIVLKKDTLGEGEIVPLTPVEQAANGTIVLPTIMTPEFAELLGLYMGDGNTKRRGGLHIVVAQTDPDLLARLKTLLTTVWGDRHGAVEERRGCWLVNVNGYVIPRFFAANGFAKPAGTHGEGAAGAFIPEKVLQAGRACVAAFLRGLFEADGSISSGVITLASASEKLTQQVQVALLGLGVMTNRRQMPRSEGRYGTRPMYEVRMLNRVEAARFASEVGFISQRKQSRIAPADVDSRGDSIAVPVLIHDFYQASQGLRNPGRQRIIGLVSNGALSQRFVREMTAAHSTLSETRLGDLVGMNIDLDAVTTITDGESYTYDISVPSNNTYIANGFVSHNTIGTMVNTSTGIEPFFSWVYYRKSRLGLHEEQVPIAREWFEANPGETQLPDYFVTAMDLSPQEHVEVQAAIQRWVDSAISKTSNLPNSYTVEQTRELYEYMYKLGCKGGTVYRDGSRDEQVLMLKPAEDKQDETKDPVNAQAIAPTAITPAPVQSAAPQVAPAATPHYVYPRPRKLQGVTMNAKTPFGNAYVTMNSDEQGCPFEVFITAPGKAGSDLQADAEGLGRMITLQLRTTAPQNRTAMLKLIIEQLQGIGGARSIGMGPNRVISLPDAVANALREHYFPEDKAEQLSMFEQTFGFAAPGSVDLADEPPMLLASTPAPTAAAPAPTVPAVNEKPADLPGLHSNGHAQPNGYLSGAAMCPSCGTVSLIRAEGCRKCLSCGYSEC